MTFPLLPPPPIFTHNEVFHAIPLPPLATFLTSLHVPEHLIKLDDILNRYRTPSSYHRLDVRLVGSSELPPFSPTSGLQDGSNVVEDGGTGLGGGNEERKRKSKERAKEREERERGQPIILPEGMSREDYLARKAQEETDGGEAEGIQPLRDQSDDAQSATDQLRTTNDTTKTPPALGHTNLSEIQTSSGPHDDINTSPLPGANEALPQGIHLNDPALPLHPLPAPVPPPADPIPTHPEPPTAPTHRIRELRLDLRTLDAAALFALETWRRQVLNLHKLDMEHPDSIWYKAPTPSPSPPPLLNPPKKVGRPRGRPKKVVRATESETDHGMVGGTKGAGDGPEEYDELLKVLRDGMGSGLSPLEFIDESEDLDTINTDLPETTILKALDELAKATQPVASGQVPLPIDAPLHGQITNNSKDEAQLDDVDYASSPDVILDDNFDEDNTKDADFAPSPAASLDSNSSTRTRKRKSRSDALLEQDINANIEKKRRGRPRKSVSFATVTNIFGAEEDDLESLTGSYTLPEAGEHKLGMGRGMDEEVASITPIIWDTTVNRRKKRNSVLESVEISQPKRQRVISPDISIPSTAIITPEARIIQEITARMMKVQKPRKEIAIETRKEVLEGDSEDEEWGFLKDL